MTSCDEFLYIFLRASPKFIILQKCSTMIKEKTQEINIGIMLLGKAQMELEFEQFLD